MSKIDKNSVVIERAASEDAKAICDVRDQARLAAYPNPELGITKDDIRLIIRGPHGEYVPRRIAYYEREISQNDGTPLSVYVAKVDGKIVGFTNPSIDERGRRRIGDMFVAPRMQGRAIGGQLMRQALEILGRDQDIYLEVVSYNDSAIGFYEHFGFRKTDAKVPAEVGRPSYLKSLPQTEMVLRASPAASV